MFKNKKPYFKRGNILKRQMLENLRDYPREFIDIFFEDYSEGIIAGADITVKDEFICINKGLIKFREKIYVLDETEKIKYFSSNEDVIIKLKFLEEKDVGDFIVYDSEVYIDKENNQLAQDEFELGRFKLREGAKLRSNYTEFTDFSTKYNTVNIINVKYSAIGNYTISPLITEEFSNILKKTKLDNNLDTLFLMQALNSKIISRELIVYYLTQRLNLNKKNYSNLEIYNYLKLIVKRLKGKESIKRGMKNNKMIVD